MSTAPARRMWSGIAGASTDRRRLLAAGLGAASAAALRSAPVLANATETPENGGSPPVDWAGVWAATAETARESGMLPSGSLTLYQETARMIDDGYLSQESAEGIGEIAHGAFGFRFMRSDPGNQSGQDYDLFINVLAFEAGSTDTAREWRGILLRPYTDRSDAVEHPDEETGVRNFRVFTISQPLASDRPDFPAHYTSGVTILNDSLLIVVSAVGYGTETYAPVVDVGSALRTSVLASEVDRLTDAGLIVPHGTPAAGYRIGLQNGQPFERYDENADEWEEYLRFADAERASWHANVNGAFPLADGRMLAMSGSAWRWNNEANGRDFFDRLPNILEPMDATQHILREFNPFDGNTVFDSSVTAAAQDAIVWPVQEDFVIGGAGVVVLTGTEALELAFFSLDKLSGAPDLAGWRGSTEYERLRRGVDQLVGDLSAGAAEWRAGPSAIPMLDSGYVSNYFGAFP